MDDESNANSVSEDVTESGTCRSGFEGDKRFRIAKYS